MNPNLSPAELAACLEILYRGLGSIRLAALDGDTARAEAIADALHNLPHLLSVGHERGWDIAGSARCSSTRSSSAIPTSPASRNGWTGYLGPDGAQPFGRRSRVCQRSSGNA